MTRNQRAEGKRAAAAELKAQELQLQREAEAFDTHGDEQLALKRLKRQVDRVTQKSDAQSTDATLMSFLHSSNLDVYKALKMWEHWIQWREDFSTEISNDLQDRGRYNDECDDQLVTKRAEWRQQSHQARQGASPVRDQNKAAAAKAAGNAEQCFEQLYSERMNYRRENELSRYGECQPRSVWHTKDRAAQPIATGPQRSSDLRDKQIFPPIVHDLPSKCKTIPEVRMPTIIAVRMPDPHRCAELKQTLEEDVFRMKIEQAMTSGTPIQKKRPANKYLEKRERCLRVTTRDIVHEARKAVNQLPNTTYINRIHSEYATGNCSSPTA